MSPITLVMLSVVVGWLATLVLHADVSKVTILDFGIGVGGAGLAARLLAPSLEIPVTSDYGLTLSGTAVTFAGALVLLAFSNLLRHGHFGCGGSKNPPNTTGGDRSDEVGHSR